MFGTGVRCTNSFKNSNGNDNYNNDDDNGDSYVGYNDV